MTENNTQAGIECVPNVSSDSKELDNERLLLERKLTRSKVQWVIRGIMIRQITSRQTNKKYPDSPYQFLFSGTFGLQLTLRHFVFYSFDAQKNVVYRRQCAPQLWNSFCANNKALRSLPTFHYDNFTPLVPCYQYYGILHRGGIAIKQDTVHGSLFPISRALRKNRSGHCGMKRKRRST